MRAVNVKLVVDVEALEAPPGIRPWVEASSLHASRTTAAQQKKKYYEAFVVKSFRHLLAFAHFLRARVPAQTVLEERKELRPLWFGLFADVSRNIVRQQLDAKEAQHVAAIKEAPFARSPHDSKSMYSDVQTGLTANPTCAPLM